MTIMTSMVLLGGMNPKKCGTSVIRLALLGLHIMTPARAVVDNGGSVRSNSMVGGDVERHKGVDVVAGNVEADKSSGNNTLEHLPNPQAGLPVFYYSLKGQGNEADFPGFLQKLVPHRSLTLPFEPFELSSFEFAEIFIIKKQLPDSASWRVGN
jgi:hypothetical protein